jgi:hypothetical protein
VIFGAGTRGGLVRAVRETVEAAFARKRVLVTKMNGAVNVKMGQSFRVGCLVAALTFCYDKQVDLKYEVEMAVLRQREEHAEQDDGSATFQRKGRPGREVAAVRKNYYVMM